MSMQEFLDGDCGNLNPVLKVASHFTNDTSLRDLAGSSAGAIAVIRPQGHEHEQELFQKFHEDRQNNFAHQLPPTTFRMENLLKEIQHLEGQQQQQQQPSNFQHNEWANEFLTNKNSEQAGPSSAEQWNHEYLVQNRMNSVWRQQNNMMGMSVASNNDQLILRNNLHNPILLQSPKELLHEDKWANEYNNVDLTNKTELMTTAENLINSIEDPNIKATEFMSFVEKISTGEIKLDDQERQLPQNVDSSADQWANEFEYSYKDDQDQSSSKWADEYSQSANAGFGGNLTENNQEFWKNLQDEWERLSKEENETHPWLSESTSNLVDQDYVFNETNPFSEVEDPLELGRKKLLAGDIPSAVLLFELAAQKDSKNQEAWLLLGTTLAQNEQDPNAIRSLNKCLELDNNNLTALMALAASYTNESYHLQACNTLQNWLKANPKYSNLVQEDFNSLISNKTTSILPSDDLIKVQRLFIDAARMSPTGEIDPDVQCGLGILFNLGSDYEKAVDCFKSALTMNPDDSLLWNRLGASLANGGKSAEAIGAYRRALEISPGFIRTRYNLGISCVNLSAYREAVDHFLSALNQQSSGKTNLGPSKNVMSDSIWNSIRMMLHILGMSDMTSAVDRRDLDLLNEKFNVVAY